MLEVKPNKEILIIKNRAYLGFTGLQAGMVIAGVLTGGILYITLPLHPMLKALTIALLMSVFVSIGFFEYNGMTFLQLVMAIIKFIRGRKPLVVKNEKGRVADECLYNKESKYDERKNTKKRTRHNTDNKNI